MQMRANATVTLSLTKAEERHQDCHLWGWLYLAVGVGLGPPCARRDRFLLTFLKESLFRYSQFSYQNIH